MKEEIFRYCIEIPVRPPLSLEEYEAIQRKLNLIHVGTELLPVTANIPQDCKDAYWRLNAGKVQLVEVCIYSDGSREIVGIVKEEA